MSFFSLTNSVPAARKAVSQECGCANLPVTAHILPQALHNMFHIVGVDVVSFQQAAVTGALHTKLRNTETAKTIQYSDKIR